jgi:hypothetical protein
MLTMKMSVKAYGTRYELTMAASLVGSPDADCSS